MKQLPLPPSLCLGDMCIDTCQRIVYVRNKPISLTCREFDVLLFLCQHEGWAITRQQILNMIWEPNTEADYHAVENIIYKIRKKIHHSTCVSIQTLIGYGYKLSSCTKMTAG